MNTSIYYQKATDIFSFVSLPTGDFYIFELNRTVNNNDPDFDQLDEDYDLVRVTKRTPINLATQKRFGFEFTLTYRPTKKWNMNGNFNLYNANTDGEFNNVDYGAENFSWFVRFNNKVTLPANIDWQTRLFYMGPREDAQNKRKGMFSTSIAFSKDLFKEKASVTLNVNDVFNTQKFSSESITPNYTSNAEFRWRQRSFNIAFTYRFNQKKKRQQRQGGFGDDDGGEGFGG